MVRAIFQGLSSVARRMALLFQEDVACVPETLHLVLCHLLRLRCFEDPTDAHLERRLAAW